jgi:outer membrane biosynthesis protein TonB
MSVQRATASRAAIVAVLGALSMAALSACGGEDAKLLPGHTARDITANLESVQELADEGDCVGAESAASQVTEQVEALGNVDRKLKEALSHGAERLSEVVAECEEAEEPETTAPVEVLPEEEPQEEVEKKAEKEEEKAEKEREKEEKAEEKEAPPPKNEQGAGGGPPGQEKIPPGQEKKEEPPSGGVESASPVEGGPAG